MKDYLKEIAKVRSAVEAARSSVVVVRVARMAWKELWAAKETKQSVW